MTLFFRYQITFLLGLLFFVFAQCSRETEILASFDGGTVTRGEMNFVIEASKRQNSEPQPITTDIQTRILESIALEKILLKDSIQNKKISEDDIQKMDKLVSDFIKLNVYMRDYVKSSLKEKPLEFILMQIALVRGEDEAENKKRADALVQKLNGLSESDIAKEISSVTDDVTRKPVGGKLEPFCTNCAETPLEDILTAVKNAPKGDFIAYSKEGEGKIVYVVRSMGTEKVHPERLVKYFTQVFDSYKKEASTYLENQKDEESKAAASYFTEGDSSQKAAQFSGHTVKQFEQGLYQREMNRIKEQSGITVGNLPQFFSPEDVDPKRFTSDFVLFQEKNGNKYTWADLEKDFSEIPTLLKQEYKDQKAMTWDMLNLFQSTILQGKIAQTSKEVQAVSEETAYKMQLDKMRVSLALKVFQDEVKAVPVTVTEAQMRDAYEAGKLYAYADPDPKNPQNRIPKPYALVRDRIKQEMEGSQKNAFVEQKVNGFKTSYNLIVASDRLKEFTR